MKRTTKRAWAATTAVIAVSLAAFVGAPIAGAADRSEAQRGAAVLGAIQNGQRKCADLTSADFEAVGEFAMQRMVGSAKAHEAMDRAMTQMMGPAGLESMHRFMGERLSGCARGPAPRGIAGVMGLMGMMGGSGRGNGPGMMGRGFTPGSGYGPGMMRRGSTPGAGYGSGMMAGGFDGSGHHDDGWGPAATVGVISLAIVVLLLIATTVAYLRRGGLSSRRTASGAAEILDRRFAAGEIDREEYKRRRAALSGSP
jgi:putative membrane protein